MKKSSWMYRRWVESIKFSLGASQNLEEVIQEKSARINLCLFFWEVVLYICTLCIMTIIAIGVTPILTTVTMCFALAYVVWKLLTGHIPNNVGERTKRFWNEERSGFFYRLTHIMALPIIIFVVGSAWSGVTESYRRYKTIRLFGRALYPIHVVLVLIGYLLYLLYQTNPVVYAEQLKTIGWWALYILSAIAVVVACILFFTTETGKVLRTYLHAKKTRVCPKIEFIDE